MNYAKAISKFDIVNKDGKAVQFQVNEYQEKCLQEATNRTVILKSRQIGFSSLWLAVFTIDFCLKENSRGVIISHDAQSAQKLLDRIKYFLESAQAKGLDLQLKYNSRHELFNANKNSSLYIGQAGSKAFGRGDTLTNLLLDEFAFYDDGERFLASALQAVVQDGRCVILTTANGMNYFHNFWERSKEKQTGFTPLFYGNQFYSEAFLQEKRLELGEYFDQEYPNLDIAAFLSSGRPFFNMDTLQWYEDTMVREPRRIGYLTRDGLRDDSNGFWKVWGDPEDGAEYFISADVGMTHDYSTALVCKTRTVEVVATMRSRLDPSEFARNLAHAGNWYNAATIAPEKNGIGLAVLTQLMELYPHIYQRSRVDKLTNRTIDELGWLTTQTSRPLILGDLQSAIVDKDYKIYDKDIIREMKQFVRNERTGKPEALPGAHDDFVMALAIMTRMLLEIYDDEEDFTLPDQTQRFRQGGWYWVFTPGEAYNNREKTGSRTTPLWA